MTHVFIFLKTDFEPLLAPYISSSRILSLTGVASNTGYMISMPPITPLGRNLVSSFTYISVIHHLSSTDYVSGLVPIQSLQKPLEMVIDNPSTVQMRNINLGKVDIIFLKPYS